MNLEKQTLMIASQARSGTGRISTEPLGEVARLLAALLFCALLFLFARPLRAAEPVRLESIELVPQLKIIGEVGALFRIEFSEDLARPTWTTLNNFVLPQSPFLFLDHSAPINTKRFYRVTWESRPPQLVRITPGSFLFGSPEIEQDRSTDEGPQISVTISKEFWIGKYEVMQADYLAVMGINPSAFSDDLNRPVENVSWTDAVAFCARLTEQERRAGRLPAGHAFRLPTEAEWEYAARAGTSDRFSYGNDPSYSQLSSYAWVGANSDETTHPVGTKSANDWGLHDMHGNVWEWCSDRYSNSYAEVSLVDPQGPTLLSALSDSDRVIRGGSWKGLSRFCRSASRSSGSPNLPNNYVGFRVVLAPVRPQ